MRGEKAEKEDRRGGQPPLMLELEVSKVKIGKYLRATGTSAGMWAGVHSAEGSRRCFTGLTMKASL